MNCLALLKRKHTNAILKLGIVVCKYADLKKAGHIYEFHPEVKAFFESDEYLDRIGEKDKRGALQIHVSN